MTSLGEAKQFFEAKASMYDTTRNKSFLSKARRHLLRELESRAHKQESYLEVGIGTGELFSDISRHFQTSVGLDVSAHMVRIAAQKSTGRDLVVGDSCSLPFASDSFDIVLSMDVLEHVLSVRSYISEIVRVCRRHGLIIVTTPNPLWAPIMYSAEKLGIKVQEGPHKFQSLPRLLRRMTQEMIDIRILDIGSFMMLPVETPLDETLERFSNATFFRFLGFSQICVMTKGE